MELKEMPLFPELCSIRLAKRLKQPAGENEAKSLHLLSLCFLRLGSSPPRESERDERWRRSGALIFWPATVAIHRRNRTCD
ncbi:hypothetical protein VNO80_29908 [Phaseolus coccineus]|uniref:Uncharacterized protein n=1 Tax=Phaseolus coccineus TaxID=3886 RepID=A0AAN9LF80_PHACN